MRIILKVIFATLLFLFFFYLVLPTNPFPAPPPNSVQSKEEGDSEDLMVRRAYFTDFSREEVINHYKKQFDRSGFLELYIPSFRLNYPPEDSQTLIRDQTMSTFLEELVHPFRESVYINGYEPKDPQNEIWYKGTHFRQKIIIKYSTSPIFVRVIIFIITSIFSYFLFKEYGNLIGLSKRKKI